MLFQIQVEVSGFVCSQASRVRSNYILILFLAIHNFVQHLPACEAQQDLDILRDLVLVNSIQLKTETHEALNSVGVTVACV